MAFKSITTFLAVFAICIGVSGASQASVVRCDNCSTSQLKAVAKSAGEGTHYIIDATQPKLTRWSVEYVPDGPFYVALPAQIAPEVQSRFLDLMERKVDAKASGQTVVTVDVDANTNDGAWYLGGFLNSTGYDVISDVGSRNLLGQSLANGVTYNQKSLFSVLLGLKSPGHSSVTVRFVVKFKNGVKVTYVLTPEQIEEAQYELGKSRDPEGHPIPDPSVTDQTTVNNTYAGTYSFQNSRNFEKLD